MAVVAVNEIVGRGARLSADGSRERRRVFQVLTNSFADDEDTVLAHVAIPQMGMPHPSDLGCYVVALDPQEQTQIAGGGSRWIVTVTYSSMGRPRCNELTITDPLKQRPEIEWTFAKGQEVVTLAHRMVNDEPESELTPILNSAGQPFIDPLMRDVTLLGARITRNESEWDPLKALNYHDAINADEFEIDGIFFPPYTAKMQRWVAVEQYIGACEKYYRHTYELDFRKPVEDGINDANGCTTYWGWDKQVVDQGTAELVEVSMGQYDLREIRGQDGGELRSPVPLDGQGERLELPIDNDNPVVTIAYRIYEAKSFSELKLPKKGDR